MAIHQQIIQEENSNSQITSPSQVRASSNEFVEHQSGTKSTSITAKLSLKSKHSSAAVEPSFRLSKTQMTSGIKENIGKLYRVDPNEAPVPRSMSLDIQSDFRDEEIGRMRCKTFTFLLLDILLTIFVISVLVRSWDQFQDCQMPFTEILVSVVVASLMSFILNFYGFYLMSKQKSMGYMFILCIILDTGLCLLGIALLAISQTPDTPLCTSADIKVALDTVGSVLLLRIAHIIILMLYIFLCVIAMCCCPNSSFVRNCLLRQKGTSRSILRKLEEWTWIFKPIVYGPDQALTKKDYPKSCGICYMNFERGDNITFLPCQFLNDSSCDIKLQGRNSTIEQVSFID